MLAITSGKMKLCTDMQVMFDDVAFRRNFHQNFCTLLRNFYKFVFYKLYPTEIGLLV